MEPLKLKLNFIYGAHRTPIQETMSLQWKTDSAFCRRFSEGLQPR